MGSRRIRISIGLLAISTLAAATSAFAAARSESSARLVTLKSPVVRGEQGHLVAYVDPGLLCGMTVFKSHPYLRMRPKRVDRWGLGLYPKHSDTDNGRIAWTWVVGGDTPLGSWRANVRCGHTTVIRTSFRLIR